MRQIFCHKRSTNAFDHSLHQAPTICAIRTVVIYEVGTKGTCRQDFVYPILLPHG